MEMNKVYSSLNPTSSLYLSYLSDPSFGTKTTRCQITTSPGVITAECTFPSDTMATGFQMIAQFSSEVHILHISQSMDLETPVTVEVEESGVYQVTIFAIREGTGIVDSYMEDVTTPTVNANTHKSGKYVYHLTQFPMSLSTMLCTYM